MDVPAVVRDVTAAHPFLVVASIETHYLENQGGPERGPVRVFRIC